MSYLCLFAYSGVQHILCCSSFDFLRLVYPMLPISLDCPFLIVPSVFSNVYLLFFLNLFYSNGLPTLLLLYKTKIKYQLQGTVHN